MAPDALTSAIVGGALGSERPGAHWPILLLLGGVLAAWMSACVFCASSPHMVLLLGLLVLIAGVVWGFRAIYGEGRGDGVKQLATSRNLSDV